MTAAPAGLLPVGLVIVAALLAAAHRRRRATRAERPRSRRAALLVVTALVGGSVLIGSPAMAQPLDCKESPEPDRPGTGLVGSLDPPVYGVGEPGSVYDEVGYAGLLWHNYDLGCAGAAVFNPASTTDTWMGNQAFNVAKFTVGGVNWSHYLIADGGELLSPLDDLITAGTTAMYDAVFSTFIGPVLAVLAVVLLLLALRGDLAQQARRGAFALVALVIGSAAYLTPVDWAKAADGLLLDGVTSMQEGFLDQVGLGNRDTLPTVLVDNVIYQNWLRGEFGSPDVPQAQELGRDLLRAQTFTKAEIAEGRDTLELAEQKKNDFAAIGERMGDRYPYFTGEAGSRTGAGILAVVQALCIALFQLLSKVLVLVAMLVLRLMVMTAPAIAVVAVLKPEILPALLRVGGAAIVNTLVVGALAGLHALLVVSLFRPGSGIDLWLALLVTGVVTVVLWAVARPFRRLVSMVSLTREQFGGIVPGAGSGPMSRVWQRMRGGPDDDRQSRWWDERRGAAAGASHTGGPRPEAEAPMRVRATAERVTRPRTEIEIPSTPTLVPGARRPALPAGGGGVGGAGAVPRWSEPGEVDDRTIYRRPDSVPRRPGGARPVQAEIVDGVPVYRIYRPPARGSSGPVHDRPVYDRTGGGRAD
ncbi:hypothetical protein I4I73_24565 [Pseudonocardia sp. KRD-184]|uniref:TrbL/VirB6 plasmid conjugal transfer protein n=1 Tax=Pseudonocardia oceani TaxID=2792013 RepID=A0ABS6UB92_9PSEU|nr:hypothetical protein [Pseudonocardia oceani]MBW0092105.1 hypothetical protein [Pseudonocardia oceani]MBW0099171.1 hypothetical protein [Pseudonocardia oceani]MBW0111674.1 hypothetical protein [Pseudonocardia oceani]MBW0125318.1 hypothetical protein [Pseudonocardia oceani]MBW0129134.1 hypothetical protein [Pseudonocardia oceani]